jgi:cell division protein DivIC
MANGHGEPAGRKAESRMRLIEGKKSRKSVLLRLAIFVFSVYTLVLLIQQQTSIREKKQQLAAMEQQIQIQEIQNDDLKSALQSGEAGSGNYIEKAAREGLDYSKPGERVYVNIAGK